MPSREPPERLFERYVLPEVEVLLRVARTLTRHEADAEDLVQDTLVRAYRAIDRFDGSHPRAWLMTILRNTHINRHRRQRPELLREGAGGGHDVAAPDRTDAFVDASLEATIERALNGLDEPFRTAVQLVDVEGLSYAEAAEALGVPAGTVMSRLHRARRKIREQLDRPNLAPRSAE